MELRFRDKIMRGIAIALIIFTIVAAATSMIYINYGGQNAH